MSSFYAAEPTTPIRTWVVLTGIRRAATSVRGEGSKSCPPGCTNTSNTYLYAREIVAQIFNVYALRMAAVFLISQATLWMRTGVMPRWMALLTYLVALVLLFVVTQASWVILVFPGWVFLVSVFILVTHLTGPRQAARAPLRRDESES